MKFVLRKGAKNVFGPALRRARERSPLYRTQADLAELLTSMGLSLDRSAVSRIENQDRSLSDIEFLYFAAALRVDPDKLIKYAVRHPNIVPLYEDIQLDDDELQIKVAEDDPDFGLY